MTRSRKPRTPALPLADTLRAALALGWHSLAALDALAGGTASTRRARVHAALAELAAAGVAREERMGSTGAEVRLAPVTMPAPMPDDGDAAEDREAARVAVEEEADGAAYSDAIPPLSPEAMAVFVDLVEHPPAPTEALRALYAGPPGPSSRCAVCDATYVKHESLNAGHPFTPKPRGRPRVTVAPIPDAAPAVLPRARQRAKRGPVVDVDGGRVERAVTGLPTDAEVDAELGAPLNREQLDAVRAWAAGAERAPCPPCIDCGEEPGSCPEGRCRDCDLEHGMSVGACRECYVWIIREEAGGPLAKQHAVGCSLATADDWRPRNAAEYTAVRVARCGWAPEPRRGCEREFPVVRVEPFTVAPPCPPGRCRPPACHRDDIHEPSRVRGFARPLCEAHRLWVEAAGGTVAPCAHQWDDRPHYRKCMYCGVEQARAGETV